MIAPQELTELMQDAGLNRQQTADWLGRRERQVRRWMHTGAPDWVGRMLRMRAGWLEEYGWQHWRIRDGRLWCGDWSEGFTPGDLFAWWWLRQRNFGYDRTGRNDQCTNEGNAMRK